jgi:UDP-N-acetylmuramate--alanine ligase
VAVFQPHQPGRLRDLWEEFCAAFGSADLLLVTDIYIARGSAIDGITAENFAKAVKTKNAHYIAGAANELPEKIAQYLQPGDLVLTLGAGDITKVGQPLLEKLKQR